MNTRVGVIFSPAGQGSCPDIKHGSITNNCSKAQLRVVFSTLALSLSPEGNFVRKNQSVDLEAWHGSNSSNRSIGARRSFTTGPRIAPWKQDHHPASRTKLGHQQQRYNHESGVAHVLHGAASAT